ncbi:MAG: BT4734/BF3469 family protein [Paludibacteraceae bacterium]
MVVKHFSFFKAPVRNTIPHKSISLLDAYNYIVGEYAKQRTEKLRRIKDPKQARQFKASTFDYCTFSGMFQTRNDKALIRHSGLLCIDFDHLQSVDLLRKQLLQDEYFETQLLFVSPSGDGIKWIIPIDTKQTTHSNYFAAVANYIQQTYGVEVDKSGRDISRACFLPHDPQAYINPLYKPSTV